MRGLREALKYNVRAVPTVIVNDRYVTMGVPDYKKLAHFKIEGLTSLLGTNSTLGLCIIGCG